jgi:multiple sugar transport system permease protein
MAGMSARIRRSPFRLSQTAQEEVAGWLFASPWIIGFLGLTAIPMAASLVLSFTNYDMFLTPKWVGVQNYVRLAAQDNLVWHSLKVTTVFALISVPLNLVFGFLLALLLNQNITGLSIWRTIFYLPSVITGISVMILWMLILSPQYGMVNAMLARIGIAGPNWLGSPQWALLSLALMSLWGVGGGMLIYLGGLQGIPSEYYDAAVVDGANSMQKFLHITLPMMSPVIFFNLVMGIIGALQTFDAAFMMTRGGPAWSTYFYMLHLFTKAFEELRMGYASGLAWVLFIYIMVLTALVFRFSQAYVFYESAAKESK